MDRADVGAAQSLHDYGLRWDIRGQHLNLKPGPQAEAAAQLMTARAAETKPT